MAHQFHIHPLIASDSIEPDSRQPTLLHLTQALSQALSPKVWLGQNVLAGAEEDGGPLEGSISSLTHLEPLSETASPISADDEVGYTNAPFTGLVGPEGRIAQQSDVSVIHGPEKPHKVIVVGAGVSGLRAASVLHRHGVDVVVLEGRENRIGGRIFTSRKNGSAPRDIGAAWMHETSQNKLVRLIPELGIEYYYDDGAPLYYTRDGRAGSQFKAKKVADEFADYCEWFYHTHPDAEDKPVLQFIREWVQNHPLVTEEERRWAPQVAREIELWIGTSLEEASSKHLSYFVTERNLYMKGGYDRIIEWIAEPLLRESETIRLGHTVNHIEWNEHGSPVTVHSTTKDSATHAFEADAVIVTVPLGVLHRGMIDFTPQLPSDLSTAFARFSYGALGKVFFEFSNVFWSKDNDQFIYYPSPSKSEIDENSVLSYATVTINLWIMSGTKELCVQIAEPLTQRIEAMTDKAAIYAFFKPLFKLMRTEPYKELPDLLSLETTHWTQDPYAGFGSYSADKAGDDPNLLMQALERHKDSHLLFAGEHCTLTGNGCVHGAFATGETAAKNLLNTFDIPHDGLDLVSLKSATRS